MTFTEAKNEFDSKYQFIKEYTCFLPEHLTMNKETKFQKKMVNIMSNTINGNSSILLYNQDYSLKIISEPKFNFQKEINHRLLSNLMLQFLMIFRGLKSIKITITTAIMKV